MRGNPVMNSESSAVLSRGKRLRLLALAAALTLPLVLMSCSKKPAQLQEDGMKAFAAGNYAKATEYFAEGIRKGGDERLYAGFIAANLMTGKYPKANAAYNDFCESIHSFLVGRYGEQIFSVVGITTKLIPFKVDGGNDIPKDYMQTITLQADADFNGFIALKDQINSALKK